ncbi:MAG: amidohydrolase family protein [Planctomycetota bacterium]
MTLPPAKRIIAVLVSLALATVAILQSGCSTLPNYPRTGSRPADLLIVNANVFTCDAKNPHAQAVAVRGERIAYVGDNAGASDFVGPETRLINARGRMLTPGFVDNHCHVLWIGALHSLMTQELYECKSFEAIKAAVLKQARENPDLPFVSGVGWHYNYIPGGVPDKLLLDSILSERPVFLMAYDGQGGWVNSKALDLMHKRNPGAFEELVPIRDKKTGQCTGFRHFHSFSPLDYFTREELGQGAQERMMRAMESTLRDALSVGVTTMNDVQIYKEFVPMILTFRDKGGLDNARVRCSYYVGHLFLKDEKRLKEDLAWWKEIGAKESGSHLKLGDSLKFYIDGTQGNRTSFQLEPFADNPHNTGEPMWTQEDFNRVIQMIDGMGLQACTHACGDAGCRRVINAYERARTVNGERDSRHRIEHCSLPTSEDQVRMGRLGIYAAMQPAHLFGDANLERAYGPQRLQRFMPWRSMEKAGVNVSFGSDWCAGPINPIYGLLIAATRINYKGKRDWAPEEKVDPRDAIRHWTLDSARALLMDKDIGSVEAGKYADLVLFDTDLLNLDSFWFFLTHEIALGKLDHFVLMTMVGGKIVHRKAGFELQ